MNLVQTFFHWPDGGVWSNIVANFVWIPVSAITAGAFGWWRIHKRLKRHESKIDAIHEHLGIKHESK